MDHSYNQLLRESNAFFGSFFSVTKNIWFRKYRQQQHARYIFREFNVVALLTSVYVVELAILIIPFCVIMLSFSKYVVWPYTFKFMLEKGMVKPKS